MAAVLRDISPLQWRSIFSAVEPPTAQKPHPPLWMGAGSPASIKKVAALGYNLLLGQFDSFEKIGAAIALFKAEVAAHGRTFDPMSVGVTRSLNIVTTTPAATACATPRDPRRAAPARPHARLPWA